MYWVTYDKKLTPPPYIYPPNKGKKCFNAFNVLIFSVVTEKREKTTSKYYYFF
jgi:hypothetical protein